jgi:hypothetical protein
MPLKPEPYVHLVSERGGLYHLIDLISATPIWKAGHTIIEIFLPVVNGYI